MDARAKTVLIVEDNELNMKLFHDLLDAHDRCFAKIAGPRWRIWTFPIRGEDGVSEGSIAKKWGGALREVFTDADTFRVEFSATPGVGGFDGAQ